MPFSASMQNEPVEPVPIAESELAAEPELPVSLSHLAHVLVKYRTAIILAVGSCVLAYLIVALALYLFAPAFRVTTQAFRLDFAGAGQGHYPNGMAFNIIEVINEPVLAHVWQANHLGNYLAFGDFSRAVYVLESNREYELIASEYQTKLADPKLSAVDRERLQKEFALRIDSVVKNEYAVSFKRSVGMRSIPEPLARKVLVDILAEWADFAVNQQHVVSYQVSILSPAILRPSPTEPNGIVATIEILRQKANSVLDNLAAMRGLPGANLVRTPTDPISLEELRLRLDDIVRFQLEPLLTVVLNSSLAGDRAREAAFLENQLAHDQRRLDATEHEAIAARDAITAYEQPGAGPAAGDRSTARSSNDQAKGSDAVVPQLNDTFLDRLITLSGRSADVQYRQKLVDEYRKAVQAAIPFQQAVAYDTQLLESMRKPAGNPVHLDGPAVLAQLDQTRTEVGQLIAKTNELYQTISRNMTASTQLFTLSGPPTTGTLRAVSLSQLALYGLLVFLLSIPVVIAACLVHNRIQEEEAADH